MSDESLESRLQLALTGFPVEGRSGLSVRQRSARRGFEGSDLDVAILLGGPLPGTLEEGGFDLAAALEATLQRPVDLVILNGAPVDLVARVLRDGRLLLDRNPSARIRFEVQARNDYFDLLPYLRQYRAAALARAAGAVP